MKSGDKIKFISFWIQYTAYTLRDKDNKIIKIISSGFLKKELCCIFNTFNIPKEWHIVRQATIKEEINTMGFWTIKMPFPIILNDGKKVWDFGISQLSMDLFVRNFDEKN